ncbi:MAG: HAMP domain-containing sensor histidine kinase [Lacrimispora sp.]|uniref:sensor histidine kinase n=1 Tax=Lacrimispora sp. TaxID=2719234 RepID=UPI0039E3DD86
MDTKLKNRHRISLILAITVVLSAATVMVGLYPFFKNESARYEEQVYEDESFLLKLISGNYVLAMEQAQREQGEMISPFRYFFPQAEEQQSAGSDGELAVEEYETEPDSKSEYVKLLRQNSMQKYESWSREFGSVRHYVDYQILDGNGEVLSDHAQEKSISQSREYVFKALLHYDSLGRMEVAEADGDSVTGLAVRLQQYGERDPMENGYWEQYIYEPELKFAKPRNMTFAYGMTARQAADLKETQGTDWSSYHVSGAVPRIFIGLVCAVGILALLFSCLDVRWAEESRILRTPFEAVLAVGGGAAAFGAGLTGLVAMTNRGELENALLRANFLPTAAGMMIKLWNLLWWALPFAIVYWAVLCMRDVFHIGLKAYIRDRTLCGYFWKWVKWLCRTVYDFLSGIDLQDQSDKTILRIVGVNFIILAILCSLWFLGIGALVIYSVALFIFMRKYYRDLSRKYRVLLEATNQIAEGNLEVTIEEDLGVFEPFKKEIQKIQSGFKVAVGEEVKSQKLKTDLISNMSHDLKTPLTAIITYVNLLREEHVTPEQRKAYIDILEQKSMRLKSLIEDLFEVSKANSNNVTLNLEDVDIVSLLKEVSYELSDKIEESAIDFRWNLPDEKIVLPLDSQKTYRIFDNLLTNIIKYGMPDTRAYIDMKKEDGYVTIALKNISASELTFNPQEITERFARGDQSRNTEGSGLGMAIAKSFVELQNGRLQVEVEADLFRVLIRWPIPL